MTDMLDLGQRSATGAATQAEVNAAPPVQPTTLVQESWRDFVFAEVWTRPGLDRRARYLISLASAIIANAAPRIVDGYVRGALKGSELSLAELREAALHLATYVGWSRGEELDNAVTRVADAMALSPAACPPICGGPWTPGDRLATGARAFEKTMTFAAPPPGLPFVEAGILNFVFAEMWAREGLDQRARRWLTLVGVCDSAAPTPIQSHIHAAMASGDCTESEMQEFALHYAIHAGWPKAAMIPNVVGAMAKKVSAGLPFNG